MYNDKTYQELKKTILDNMNVVVDKREGSFVNDMISPIGIQLAEAYMSLQDVLSLTFAETSSGEYLDKRVHEFGVYRKGGIKAVGKIEFVGNVGVEVGKGIEVSTVGGLVYVTTNGGFIGEGGKLELTVEAKEVGKKYNVIESTVIILVTNVFGIDSVINKSPMVGGVDIENDEELIARFLEAVQTPITSGNIHHYKKWAMEVDGVGDAVITPLWNGNGTVRVLIIDNERQATTPQLITDVFNHIEEVRPIGAEITVVTGINKLLSVKSNVTIAEGFKLADIKAEFSRLVKEYLKRITFRQGYVSMAYIGSLLLTIEGVLDYHSFTLNGKNENVVLGAEDVPVLDSNINFIV